MGTSTSWNPQGLSRPVMRLKKIIYLDVVFYQKIGFLVLDSNGISETIST